MQSRTSPPKICRKLPKRGMLRSAHWPALARPNNAGQLLIRQIYVTNYEKRTPLTWTAWSLKVGRGTLFGEIVFELHKKIGRTVEQSNLSAMITTIVNDCPAATVRYNAVMKWRKSLIVVVRSIALQTRNLATCADQLWVRSCSISSIQLRKTIGKRWGRISAPAWICARMQSSWRYAPCSISWIIFLCIG